MLLYIKNCTLLHFKKYKNDKYKSDNDNDVNYLDFKNNNDDNDENENYSDKNDNANDENDRDNYESNT